MLNMSDGGRVLYSIAIIVIGLATIYYGVIPYMLLPPQFLTPGYSILAYILGFLFISAGSFIILKKQTSLVSLLHGFVLLAIFCFLFIPYMFSANSNYRHLTEWENAEKELALAGGAFVIAGYFSIPKSLKGYLKYLIRFGSFLFAIPIASFGILHFMYGPDVAGMVPSWIPFHLFWIYFAGAALIGSGIAIILNIKIRLIAALLGTMIFIWFVILHMPDVFASSSSDMAGQITSAFIALAYSGTAFGIAGAGGRMTK